MAASVKLALIGAVSSACLCACPAQAASIYIDAEAKDAVGRQLVYELREIAADSKQHKLVNSEDDAGFFIHIVTVENTENASTAYAVTLTMLNFASENGTQYYIATTAGVCGANRISYCARSIFAGTDQSINEMVSTLQDALNAGGAR